MKKVFGKIGLLLLVIVMACCALVGCKDVKVSADDLANSLAKIEQLEQESAKDAEKIKNLELEVAKGFAKVDLLKYKYFEEYTDLERARYLKIINSVDDYATIDMVKAGVDELKKQIDLIKSLTMVEFSMNAHVVNADYIVEPTVIVVDDQFLQTLGEKYGHDLASMKQKFNYAYLTDYMLSSKGIEYKHGGNMEESYYLREISYAYSNKIDEDFINKYKKAEVDITVPTDFSKLAEKQYNSSSGFMYNVNDEMSMDYAHTIKPRNGDTCTWYFTIAMGSDYSSGWGTPMVEKVNRRELDTLIACANYLKSTKIASYIEGVKAVATMGVKQTELDERAGALRKELFGK